MATFTDAECARCVLLFHETNSALSVQRRFHMEYGKDPPSRPTIYSWHKNFVETGCSVRHEKSPGRPQVSDAVVEQIRESFARCPMDFFLWGFIKDKVYVPPLPDNLADLRNRISAAVAEVTPDLLERVWREIDFRWDVCRITNGSHIEPK